MIRLVQRFHGKTALFVTAALLLAGCATTPRADVAPPARTVLFVPGVFGDGPWYDGLRKALAAEGTAIRTVTWGLPKPLFAVNFSNKGVHDKAERQLAAEIDATAGDVDLVGHSAGCGVILGSLSKTGRGVGRIVLIAPSVSPGYDLTPSLARATLIDVFHSDRDTTFLKWRCTTFGTYDGVQTPAAGYMGFAAMDPKLRQHAYDPEWRAIGHDGGHGGGTGEAFVKAMIAPRFTKPGL